MIKEPDLESDFTTIYRVAEGYYDLGMIVECQIALETLTNEDRYRQETLNLLALVSIHQEDWGKAIEYCDQAAKLYPELPFSYVNQAFAEHELGHTEDALAILEKAQHVVNAVPVANYNRGCYLVHLKRLREAVFWVNKALLCDPTLSDCAATDPDLAEIRSQLNLQHNSRTFRKSIRNVSEMTAAQ